MTRAEIFFYILVPGTLTSIGFTVLAYRVAYLERTIASTKRGES